MIRSHLTQLSGELWRALTREAVQHRVTQAAVLARPAGARVSRDLTAGARKARQAQAAVALRTLLQNTDRKLGSRGARHSEWNRAGKSIRTLHVPPFWH